MGIWKDGIMGAVTGDALGCPVEFREREELAVSPVSGMRGHGTFDQPAGTWTDDSSMTLATLDSILTVEGIDLKDIMRDFMGWYFEGSYTPFGTAFDIGGTCSNAITKFARTRDPKTCGDTTEDCNGNGSLMRIMPACLYCYSKKMSDDEAVKVIHDVSALTHAHLRSKMACGLYYFCVKAVLDEDKNLIDELQDGIDNAVSYYKQNLDSTVELANFARLTNLYKFRDVPSTEIKSSGYVIDTIEASIWSLITTTTLKQALLTAVNLGEDTDTVAAIAGGLAGLYYGYGDIPSAWLSVIQRREWIEGLCDEAEKEF